MSKGRDQQIECCHLPANSCNLSGEICKASIGNAGPPDLQSHQWQDEDEEGPQSDADHQAHEPAVSAGKVTPVTRNSRRSYFKNLTLKKTVVLNQTTGHSRTAYLFLSLFVGFFFFWLELMVHSSAVPMQLWISLFVSFLTACFVSSFKQI